MRPDHIAPLTQIELMFPSTVQMVYPSTTISAEHFGNERLDISSALLLLLTNSLHALADQQAIQISCKCHVLGSLWPPVRSNMHTCEHERWIILKQKWFIDTNWFYLGFKLAMPSSEHIVSTKKILRSYSGSFNVNKSSKNVTDFPVTFGFLTE